MLFGCSVSSVSTGSSSCWRGPKPLTLVTSLNALGPLTAEQPTPHQHNSQLDSCSALSLYSFFKEQPFPRTFQSQHFETPLWYQPFIGLLAVSKHISRAEGTCSGQRSCRCPAIVSLSSDFGKYTAQTPDQHHTPFRNSSTLSFSAKRFFRAIAWSRLLAN